MLKRGEQKSMKMTGDQITVNQNIRTIIVHIHEYPLH